MSGPSPRGDKLGPLGDKILFENDMSASGASSSIPANGKPGTSMICPM